MNRDAVRDHLMAAIVLAALVWWSCFGERSILHAIDYQLIIRPQLQFALESLRAGETPWWNPYVGLGRPLMTDIHYGLWYPPTYLLLLGEGTGVFLLVWLHYLLLWSGMRQLILRFGGTRALAFIGGIVLCLTGNFNGRLLSGMFYYVFQECYAPWILLLTLRLGDNWNGRTVAALALASSASFLCGNGHVFWILHCGAGLTLFFRSLLALRREMTRKALAPLGQWVVAMLFVVGLCTFAWQPYRDLVEMGNRQATSYEFAAFGSGDAHTLYSMLYGILEVPGMDWEQNCFVGVFWCLAGIIGFVRLRHVDLAPLLITTAFCMLFAVGSNTPFHQWVTQVLPGADLFRVPPRIMLWPTVILVAIAGAWLSRVEAASLKFPLAAVVVLPFIGHLAWFLDLWRRMPPMSLHAMGTFVVGAVAILLWPRLRSSALLRLRPVLLAGVVALEFVPYTYHIQQAYVPPAEGMTSTVAGDAFIDDVVRRQAARPAGQPAPRVNLPVRLASPNSGLSARVAGINADTPLFLDRPWRYLNLIGGENPQQPLNNCLPASITERRSEQLPHVSLDYEFDPLTGRAMEVWNPFPRAYFSSACLMVTNADEALAAVMAGVPVGEVTIVESDHSGVVAPSFPAEEPPVFLEYGHNRISVALTNDHPGYLVLNEAWFPGWKARRDGVEYETVPANVWMRGVRLPAGTGTIEFFFEPRNLIGGSITSLGVTLLLIALLIGQSKRPQPGPGGTVIVDQAAGSPG